MNEIQEMSITAHQGRKLNIITGSKRVHVPQEGRKDGQAERVSC